MEAFLHTLFHQMPKLRMPSANSPPALPLQTPKKWQFSLRTMLFGTTAFAIFLGLATALPTAFSQALIGLIWIAATGWLITGLFFAHGDQRAFCIGAAIVVSSTWTGIGGRFLQGFFEIFSLLFGGIDLPRAITLWLNHSVVAATALANGWLCIQARRYFEQESPQ